MYIHISLYIHIHLCMYIYTYIYIHYSISNFTAIDASNLLLMPRKMAFRELIGVSQRFRGDILLYCLLETYVCVYIYIYILYTHILDIHICMYIYIYICIYRERGICMCVYIYIYILYTYIHTYKVRNACSAQLGDVKRRASTVD